jgi:hypothetical protein
MGSSVIPVPRNFRLVVRAGPPRAPIEGDRDDVYVPDGAS